MRQPRTRASSGVSVTGSCGFYLRPSITVLDQAKDRAYGLRLAAHAASASGPRSPCSIRRRTGPTACAWLLMRLLPPALDHRARSGEGPGLQLAPGCSLPGSLPPRPLRSLAVTRLRRRTGPTACAWLLMSRMLRARRPARPRGRTTTRRTRRERRRRRCRPVRRRRHRRGTRSRLGARVAGRAARAPPRRVPSTRRCSRGRGRRGRSRGAATVARRAGGGGSWRRSRADRAARARLAPERVEAGGQRRRRARRRGRRAPRSPRPVPRSDRPRARDRCGVPPSARRRRCTRSSSTSSAAKARGVMRCAAPGAAAPRARRRPRRVDRVVRRRRPGGTARSRRAAAAESGRTSASPTSPCDRDDAPGCGARDELCSPRGRTITSAGRPAASQGTPPEGFRQHRFAAPPGATTVLLVRHGESAPAHPDRPVPDARRPRRPAPRSGRRPAGRAPRRPPRCTNRSTRST